MQSFGYALEDIDQIDGADVYNGQNSTFWNNIRRAFKNELRQMYRNLRSQGKFSYDKVEKMFEDHQAKWSEAIFNEDAYFKYLEPLINDDDDSYLEMLQGSKEEQRKWWLYNRFRYLDSKYNAGDAQTDYITIRAYRKADVTITPYADIYATIKYGSYLVQERAQRNVPVVLANPLDELNDTECYIYSASQLASVGDLSGLNVGYANFSMATKLQSIKVGDADPNYSNPRLTSLSVGNSPLLRTVDARNCPNLTQTVNLENCKNIEHVYLSGTSTTGVRLPNGGILKTLQLPSTVTNLTIRNQPQLSSFTLPDTSNLTTLWIENVDQTVVPYMTMLDNMPENSRIRIIGFTKAIADYDDIVAFYDKLDTMRGLDEQGNNMDKAQIKGTINTNLDITGDQLAALYARYPDITVTYASVTSTLTYKNYDGTETLYTETILNGGDGTWNGVSDRPADEDNKYLFAGWSRIVGGGLPQPNAVKNVTASRTVFAAFTPAPIISIKYMSDDGTTTIYVEDVTATHTGTYSDEPTKDPTAQYTYTFAGWSLTAGGEVDPNALLNVNEKRTVYAVFTPVLRSYAVTFYNADGAVLQTSTEDYGATPEYTQSSDPEFPVAETNYTFSGWNEDPEDVTVEGVTKFVAQYINSESTVRDTLDGSLPTLITDDEEIASYEYSNCPNLLTVDLTSAEPVTINDNAFADCTNLNAVFIRSEEGVATLAHANAFPIENFRTGTACIYVPAELIDEYKAAKNWKTFASRIYAIEDYPVANPLTSTDLSTITESYADMVAAMESDIKAYNIGDTKQVSYTTEGITKTVLLEVVGKGLDTLADGVTKANYTLLCKDIAETRQMNSTAPDSIKWETCTLKSYMGTIYNALPEALRTHIKNVQKTNYSYIGGMQTLNEKVWIPSYYELNGTNWGVLETSGVRYPQFRAGSSHAKYLNGTAQSYLTRTYNSSKNVVLATSLTFSDTVPTNNYGVVFGLCV